MSTPVRRRPRPGPGGPSTAQLYVSTGSSKQMRSWIRGLPVNHVGRWLQPVRHSASAAVAGLVVGVGLLVAGEKPAPHQPDVGRVEPFKIAVEEAVLRDLHDRLGR